MRYRPEHWNRSTQTLLVYTDKGRLTRTIPLSAPAAEALADREAVGAIGPFSTSTLRRAFIRAAARLGIHGDPEVLWTTDLKDEPGSTSVG